MVVLVVVGIVWVVDVFWVDYLELCLEKL